jgi:hypothetical protein
MIERLADQFAESEKQRREFIRKELRRGCRIIYEDADSIALSESPIPNNLEPSVEDKSK